MKELALIISKHSSSDHDLEDLQLLTSTVFSLVMEELRMRRERKFASAKGLNTIREAKYASGLGESR